MIMKNDVAEFEWVLAIIFIILVIALIIFGIIIPFVTQDYVTLTVTDKETYTSTDCSDSDGHRSCSTNTYKLIYTNGEILQFDDTFVLWVFGSQTMYSHIEEDQTYKFKVWGFNVPWLNMYRNVISYEKILR
jgi:hypothetical protein